MRNRVSTKARPITTREMMEYLFDARYGSPMTKTKATDIIQRVIITEYRETLILPPVLEGQDNHVPTVNRENDVP
jgi:hypothetical protein